MIVGLLRVKADYTFHEMSGQNNCAPKLVFPDQLPQLDSVKWIKARSWLILTDRRALELGLLEHF
jgi:hypothetical protein